MAPTTRTRHIAFARAVAMLLVVVVGSSSVQPQTAAFAAARDPSQFDQGLQDGWGVGDEGQISGGQLVMDNLQAMQQAGAGWVRINFRLGPCFRNWTSDGCNGQTALRAYDQVVGAATARGLRVLGLLSAETWHGDQGDWTAQNAEFAGGNGANPYIAAFAQQAAGVLASHFVGQVDAWEVWNEPNAWSANPARTMYTGASFMHPSNFAQLLRQSHAAIKGAAPQATVMSGGLLGTDVGSLSGYQQPRELGQTMACPSGLPSGGDYLCATYAMGWRYAGWVAGASPFDQVGQHIYIDQNTLTTPSRIRAYLADLRAVYVAYGGESTTMTTHVTEFGWSTSSVSPQVQAYNLGVAYRTFNPTQTPFVGRAYWFRLQDVPGKEPYGMVDPAGLGKPAWDAYLHWAAF